MLVLRVCVASDARGCYLYRGSHRPWIARSSPNSASRLIPSGQLQWFGCFSGLGSAVWVLFRRSPHATSSLGLRNHMAKSNDILRTDWTVPRSSRGGRWLQGPKVPRPPRSKGNQRHIQLVIAHLHLATARSLGHHTWSYGSSLVPLTCPRPTSLP
ncbi:hypothetical protein BJ875DRAFT_471259 [Amylocarpus encephaloides]|uniref:Uncharacterized protein n=1 Tax=Amylocarpus encephaloides TaxID=45428 RepID=A0A9P8C1X6_9HELO|nr:hypothetical protein BJ875DRAFT_471259 [Amylocarpus encephaloides]